MSYVTSEINQIVWTLWNNPTGRGWLYGIKNVEISLYIQGSTHSFRRVSMYDADLGVEIYLF